MSRLYDVQDRTSNCQHTVASIREGSGPRVRLSPQGTPWFHVQMVMGTVTGSISLDRYAGICTSDMGYCRVLAILSGRNHQTRRFKWVTLSHLGGGMTQHVSWDKLVARHHQVGGPHFGVLFTNDAVEATALPGYEGIFDRFRVPAGGRFIYKTNARECDVGVDCRGAIGEIDNGFISRTLNPTTYRYSYLQALNGNGSEAL